MGAIGFIDDKGARVTFADALAGKGEFAIRRPMLAAMARQKPRYCDASITELLPAGMQRQRILQTRHDYYIVPDRQTFILWGSAIHALLERHAAGDAVVEEPLTVELDGLKVGGTADTRQLWKPGTLRKGWSLEIIDWKTTNIAAVKRMVGEDKDNDKLRDGGAQLNAYWTLENISPDSMLQRAKMDPAKVEPVLVLENLSRDHREYEATREAKGKPYPRWHEPVEVPAAPVAETLATLRAAVRAWKRNQKLGDDALPKCEDVWGGRRCRDYCEAMPFCRYAAENIEKLTGARNY
jgi:hypothetical protein